MRRLIVIAITFAVTLAGFVAGARHWWLAPAMAEGRALYVHRGSVRRNLDLPTAAARHRVLAMGDSTTMGRRGNPPWPLLLAARWKAQGVAMTNDAYPGQDIVHHYCLLPAYSLDQHFDAVVVLVNLRVMVTNRRKGAATDLCSYLPPATLARSLLLPWHDRGVTLVRLALTRAMRVEWIERSVFFLEGVRRLFVDRWLPAVPRRPEGFRTVLRQRAERYDEPLRRGHPHLRMLRALVAEIRRRGAAALVVVSPVPLEWLQTMVPVDPEEWAARMAVVREAVEDAGGEMLDLHDLLPPAEFSDTAGHMTPVGHRHIAEAVALPLGALLGLPAAQRTGTAAPGRP